MSKSYSSENSMVKYTVDNSLRQHPLQAELQAETLGKAPRGLMLGAPEVLQLCSNILRMIKAKRVLDIGMFTGASALAWALALPADGEVHTMDVSDDAYNKYGKAIVERDANIAKKIHRHIRPALETLDGFIKSGEAGKFDFAFIDADKDNYGGYYERALTLLRPGGFIAVDNAIWSGAVCKDEATMDVDTLAIHRLNQKIHKDVRVDCSLLTTGDGLMLAFKK